MIKLKSHQSQDSECEPSKTGILRYNDKGCLHPPFSGTAGSAVGLTTNL